MNSFIYNIPVKVYFGENQLQHLGEELAKFGKRVLLTYGGGSIKRTGLYDAVVAEVKNGITVLPVKSYCSRNVLMIVGAIYHQMG